MKVEYLEKDAVVIIRVKGNLVGGPETFSVHEKVKALLQEKKTRFVIDLSDVSWINSSGIGMLMGCLTSIKTAGGALKLSGIGEKVKNLFIITKLITLFDTYDSVDEAVNSFSKS